MIFCVSFFTTEIIRFRILHHFGAFLNVHTFPSIKQSGLSYYIFLKGNQSTALFTLVLTSVFPHVSKYTLVKLKYRLNI